MTLKDTITAKLAEFGITVVAEYKAQADVDTCKYSDLKLNYEVDVLVGGRSVIKTPYSMGIAHIPGYDDIRKGLNGSMSYGAVSIDTDKVIRGICASGRGLSPADLTRVKLKQMPYGSSGPAILPDPADVMHCLVMDGYADDSTFEDWAGDCGYDTDSRKALAIYETCVEHGRALRLSLGMERLVELRELFQDY